MSPQCLQHAEQSRSCERKDENSICKVPRATKTIRPMASRKNIPGIALLCLLLATAAAAQSPRGGTSETNSQDSERPSVGQIQTPNRPASPLFKSSQGKQRTEIHFDPATRTVTIKLLVQDPDGYFIPNIHRQNFVVYENGIQQQNTTVEVEHARASLGLLIEFGGQAPGMNRDLGEEVSSAGQLLLDEIGHDDSLGIWKYSEDVQKLSEFSNDKEAFKTLFLGLGTPELSETNLYDAIIFTLEQMRRVTGRKAILLISSGIDTFSKASYQDALKAVQESDTPIYALGLGRLLSEAADLRPHTGALAQIDWTKAEKTLEEICGMSGGRAYIPQDTLDLSPVYDDMLEHLKVRYVITYSSPSNVDLNSPRTVRIELIDPKTGGPLNIIDSSGKPIRAKVVVQDSYTPGLASVR
jgi:Ca-activated chloride channel homolog